MRPEIMIGTVRPHVNHGGLTEVEGKHPICSRFHSPTRGDKKITLQEAPLFLSFALVSSHFEAPKIIPDTFGSFYVCTSLRAKTGLYIKL